MFIWLSLLFALAPAIGMTWVFNWLRQGGTIIPDNLNTLEFWLATAILLLIVSALIVQTKRTFKRRDCNG